MSKKVISEKQYQEDLSRGYTILHWQSRRSKVVKDLRTGGMTEVRQAPVDVFRCMECQFDTVVLETMQKHLAGGEHPWSYVDGDTPYGPMYLVDIENSGVQTTTGE